MRQTQSNDRMEELNRIKIVLVERKKTNKWLASKEIELEFGLNVEEQEAQQNFFDWLHSKEK